MNIMVKCGRCGETPAVDPYHQTGSTASEVCYSYPCRCGTRFIIRQATLPASANQIVIMTSEGGAK